MCSSSSASSSIGRHAVGRARNPFRDRVRVARDRSQREQRGDCDADLDRDDEVERDRRGGGEHEHERVGPGGAQHHADAVDVDHAHGGDHQHAGERGERDAGHERTTQVGDAEEHDRVGDRRQAGTPAGAHVDRGASDGAGGGHASEQRGRSRLASPWPNSSRSGSCGSVSLMPSATLAESRLSRPRAAPPRTRPTPAHRVAVPRGPAAPGQEGPTGDRRCAVRSCRRRRRGPTRRRRPATNRAARDGDGPTPTMIDRDEQHEHQR